MTRTLSRSSIRRRNQARKEMFQMIALCTGFIIALPFIVTLALIWGSSFVDHSLLAVAWLNMIRSTLGGLL